MKYTYRLKDWFTLNQSSTYKFPFRYLEYPPHHNAEKH